MKLQQEEEGGTHRSQKVTSRKKKRATRQTDDLRDARRKMKVMIPHAET
jgi:hypothetical protein